MKINNCQTCGGKIEFSPDNKALKCEKCANIYPIDYKALTDKKRMVNENIENEQGFEEWKESKRTFQCKNCGAQIILNKFDMSTKCSYCNTSSLVATESLPGLKPDAVIPFKISKEKANEKFKINIRKKMFLPKDFKKNLPKTQIGATYISSFSFDSQVFATYKGIKTETRTRHTKNGPQTYTVQIPFSGSIDRYFKDIVVETSDKINQTQIKGILPYYFTECYQFDDDFLTGFSVEYYNQAVSEANNIARQTAVNDLDIAIRRQYGSVVSLTINPTFSNERYNYVLLPLYFINYKYKDKEYLNLMNGQTGATSGKVPRSAAKITMFVLLIVGLVIGLPLLFVLLTALI